MSLGRCCVLLSLVAISGCSSGYSPDVPPGYTTGTPRQTTYYLQWAFEKEYPLHVANCLSEGLMKREGFTRGDLELFWPEVKKWAAENLGDVQQIEIDDIVDLEDETAEMKLVTYRVGNRLIPLRFKRQVTWEVRHQRTTTETLSGSPRRLADLAAFEDGQLVIRLDGVTDQETYAPENIEKIVITSAWLVDSVDPKDLEKLGVARPRP